MYFGYWKLGSVAGEPVYSPSVPKLFNNTTVDFNINNGSAYPFIIPVAVEQTESGGAVTVKGNSIRPWNGGTTYIDGDGKTITVLADGGTVYLGGMRTNFDIALHGEGSAQAVSSYTEMDHFAQVDKTVSLGTGSVSCFLGERLTMTALPAPGVEFFEWSDNVTSNQFQAVDHGLVVDAVFSTPGVDLRGKWDERGAPLVTSFKAGDTVSATLGVRNIGQEETDVSNWSDGLFLSRDAVYDAATDYELQVASHAGALLSGSEYTVPLTGTIPDVAPGVYYILGVTDKSNVVSEVNNSNNTVATGTVVLDANLAQ